MLHRLPTLTKFITTRNNHVTLLAYIDKVYSCQKIEVTLLVYTDSLVLPEERYYITCLQSQTSLPTRRKMLYNLHWESLFLPEIMMLHHMQGGQNEHFKDSVKDGSLHVFLIQRFVASTQNTKGSLLSSNPSICKMRQEQHTPTRIAKQGKDHHTNRGEMVSVYVHLYIMITHSKSTSGSLDFI